MFPTTIWQWVNTAGEPGSPGFNEAIAELCRRYWYPVYCFIRSQGKSSDEALDLTQEYFARLLDRRLFAAADAGKGRFRALLMTDCRHFLVDQKERSRAFKRGSGRQPLSLSIDGEVEGADRRYRVEPVDQLDPEALFDRAWALEVLNQALERLQQLETEAGRGEGFAHYRSFLVAGATVASHAELAQRLGLSEQAVGGALRRLRKRYGQVLCETVAETLSEPNDETVQEEIRSLFSALGRPGAPGHRD